MTRIPTAPRADSRSATAVTSRARTQRSSRPQATPASPSRPRAGARTRRAPTSGGSSLLRSGSARRPTEIRSAAENPRVEWNRLNSPARCTGATALPFHRSVRQHSRGSSAHEPVRDREVHHAQPRGDRGRPAVGDHGRAHRHGADPPARRPAAPGGGHRPDPRRQGRRRRARPRGGGGADDEGAAERERRHRAAARRLARPHPRAGRRARPGLVDEGRLRRHRAPADRDRGHPEPGPEAAHRRGPHRGRPARGTHGRPRQPAGDQPGRRVDVRGAGEVLRRPHHAPPRRVGSIR